VGVCGRGCLSYDHEHAREFCVDHFQVRWEAHADHASCHPAGIPLLHVFLFALLEGLYSAVCSARDSNLHCPPRIPYFDPRSVRGPHICEVRLDVHRARRLHPPLSLAYARLAVVFPQDVDLGIIHAHLHSVPRDEGAAPCVLFAFERLPSEAHAHEWVRRRVGPADVCIPFVRCRSGRAAGVAVAAACLVSSEWSDSGVSSTRRQTRARVRAPWTDALFASGAVISSASRETHRRYTVRSGPLSGSSGSPFMPACFHCSMPPSPMLCSSMLVGAPRPPIR